MPKHASDVRASKSFGWSSLCCLCSLLFNFQAAISTVQAQGSIEAWVQRYNGPGNGNDVASAMAVDTNGNVYVTGYVLAEDGSYSYATIKYSNAGVPLWTNRYDRTGIGDDLALAMALDASGNVYVTGYSSRSGSGDDYATVAYSSAGLALWTSRYNGPANSTDEASAIAVDLNGNVFVTGFSVGSGTGDDYATIKYSTAGVPLWTNRYNGPANDRDWARAVAVDANGNVFVTGLSIGDGTFEDYVTIAYSSTGVPLWTNRYNGPQTNGQDQARAMAVDSSGNVIVTGWGSGDSGADYTTIKYSGAGVPLWTNRYHGPGIYGAKATAVAVDSSGNVIVTGDDSGNDYATIKYSSAGVPLWTNRYNGTGNGDDTPKAVALDAGGNVYVTGQSPGSGSGFDYSTVAYSSAGMPLWTNRYNGPGNGWDSPSAIAVDASGDVFVTGASAGNGSSGDLVTIKYVVSPIIARQPLSRTNATGTTASFTVEVAGSAPFSYQWRQEEKNLLDGGFTSGATTTNLVLREVQPADALGYSVVVTNAYGSVTSTVAQLTVTLPPSPGRFTKLSYSPDSGFSFIFRDATVGQSYRIQRSSSLAQGNWEDWRTFTYTEPIGFIDVGAAGTERRFYRAVSP